MYYERYVKRLISLLLDKKKSFEDAVMSVIPQIIRNLFKKRLGVELSKQKILLPLFYASFRENYSISLAVEYLQNHGYQTYSAKYILDKVRQLNAENLAIIFDYCREMIFQALSKLGFNKRSCLVAIDYHDKPFYGDKKVGQIVGCKRKGGTNYAYRYITASIVEEGNRFNLATMPATLLDNEQALLTKVISFCKKYMQIGCLLLDRGFNSVENYKLLEEKLNLKYIMPQQTNEKLDRMLKDKNLTAYSQFQYTFYENRAEEYRYSVKMFYIITEEGEKYTFVTNIVANDEEILKIIIQCYDKRWGIETGYRVESNFLCKTTSKSFNIRTFFALLSFFLQDLWTFCNYLLHQKKGTQEPRRQKIEQGKTLADFLKAASEKLNFVWRPLCKALIFCEQCCDNIIHKLKRKLVSC